MARVPKSKWEPKSALTLMPLDELRPTQMAVGMGAVLAQKRKLEARTRKAKRPEDVLAARPIPTVRGPGGSLFIVDRHHLALALCLAKFAEAYTRVITDFSALSRGVFWRRMEAEGWVYPYDEDGQRAPVWKLPRRLEELRHDPFRDLAWQVREAGGFQKSPIPYAEFRWSAFFRERISTAALRRSRVAAFESAMALCGTSAAAGLPGYLGYA